VLCGRLADAAKKDNIPFTRTLPDGMAALPTLIKNARDGRVWIAPGTYSLD